METKLMNGVNMKPLMIIITAFAITIAGTPSLAQSPNHSVLGPQEFLDELFTSENTPTDSFVRVITSHCENSILKRETRTRVQADLCSLNEMIKSWITLKDQLENSDDLDTLDSISLSDSLFSLVFDHSRFYDPSKANPLARAFDFILLSSAIEYGFEIVNPYLSQIYGDDSLFSRLYLPMIQTQFTSRTQLSRYIRITEITGCKSISFSCVDLGNASFSKIASTNISNSVETINSIYSIPEPERNTATKKLVRRLEVSKKLVDLSKNHLRPNEFITFFRKGELTGSDVYSQWIDLYNDYTDTMLWFNDLTPSPQTYSLLSSFRLMELSRKGETVDGSQDESLILKETSKLIMETKNGLKEDGPR